MNVHLHKDVRTLDLQVIPASGVKEENFPLLIPALECFYHPYKSIIISISVCSDFPETTLEVFFSVICTICSGHAGMPIMASPGPARVIPFIFYL